MKIKLLILFVPALLMFCSTAHAQAVLSNQVVVTQIPDHPLHAEPHAMGREQYIVGGSADTYTYAHGERPLWEFGETVVPKPLGDVAREYRAQKLTARKAEITLDQQGPKDEPKTR